MKKESHHLPTVTVAISAFNEEKNIEAFLRSVLEQIEEGFQLFKILVYSDGSTDRTVEVVRSLHDPKIIVYDFKERSGKSTRLNQIYSQLATDFLVQSDADVVWSQPYLIRDMILPMIADQAVGMCGGNPNPRPGVTFTEKAVNCTFNAYAPLRQTWRGGDNALSSDGRMLAYRKELVKKITVPVDMTSNDCFTYFCCLTNGYKYKFVPSAIVWFRSPQNIKDQVKQNTRFLACPIRMSKYFPPDLVRREKRVPKRLLLASMAKQFITHPIMCTYIYLINAYCRLRVRGEEKKLNAKWAMAYSTKSFS